MNFGGWGFREWGWGGMDGVKAHGDGVGWGNFYGDGSVGMKPISTTFFWVVQ